MDDIHDVIVVYNQNESIWCASYNKYNAETVELKRVFIRSKFGGQGVSKVMLKKLEERAKGQGYNKMILESGELLKAAMNLYRAVGYEVIQNYGQYAEM